MIKRTTPFCARLLALTLAVSLALSGCGASNESVQKEFDTFLATLPKELVSSDSMNLNYMFKNPGDFGIEQELQTLPYYDITLVEEDSESTKVLMEKLEAFESEKLTQEQQLTKKVLLDSLSRNLERSQYYYLDTNFLGSFTGFQAQLPLLLDEYNFTRKIDVDSYINILETSEEYFKKYAQIERDRQAAGAGMSQDVLDGVIGQCESFVSGGSAFLVESFNRRIDATDFLTEEEKAAYKVKAEEVTTKNFIQAYKTLGEELGAIEGSADTHGLATTENGPEYYAALIRANVGIDETPEELELYLGDKYRQYLTALQMMVQKDPTLFDRVMDAKVEVDIDNVDEMITFLHQATAQDFPALPVLSYKINYVDESMQENFSPAAYLTSRIDTPITDQEIIILNGDFKSETYPTLAHEGYPGHMYQTVYYKSLNPPVVRRMLDYLGYTEGWASYVESYVTRYTALDADLAEFVGYYNGLIHVYYAMMDLGIHYSGWNKDDLESFLVANFGPQEPEVVTEIYNLICELPSYYLYYYVGEMRMEDLRMKAMDELGDKFVEMDFHKSILDAGPCSFPILEEQVDAYIAATK